MRSAASEESGVHLVHVVESRPGGSGESDRSAAANMDRVLLHRLLNLNLVLDNNVCLSGTRQDRVHDAFSS